MAQLGLESVAQLHLECLAHFRVEWVAQLPLESLAHFGLEYASRVRQYDEGSLWFVLWGLTLQ
jgi:hypothetical protein